MPPDPEATTDGRTYPAGPDRQAYGLRLPAPGHPELRRLQGAHAPAQQGHRLWNSTWLLLDFLIEQRLPPGLAVLEAGSGWGLAGIWCARHLAATVTAVDVDPEVFPFLDLHARLNHVEVTTEVASFDRVPDEVLAGADVLIGADICFHEHMVPSLFGLVQRALDAGVGRVALSDPGRMAFRSLASRCVGQLGAAVLHRQVQEPLLSWPGEAPRLEGRLLTLGPGWARPLAPEP